MTASIIALETVVPDTILRQGEVRDVFAAQPGLSRLAQRLIPATFDAAAIETRHTAIDELSWQSREEHPQFFDRSSGLLLSPGTRARNDLYTAKAGALYVRAARAACAGIDTDRISHVVTVSCTGFFAPGPDFLITRELGLRPGVQRFHLGFMGCYAAIPALRLAKQLVEADPSAVVLVVSVELCTLHVRSSSDPDQIVAASIFADGAAAAVVASAPEGTGGCSLDAFETAITPDGEGDMAWTIGDEGFTMVLSSYVPKIIDSNIVAALEPLLRGDGASVEHWAIHPGGRSILDRVEATLGLSESQLTPSRETMREFGNMSSATVLFVLQRILRSATPGERICAMAFGPGLTVESALLTAN